MTVRRKNRRYDKPTVPQIRRMTDLRNAGLSIAGAAVVVNLDSGTHFTVEQVRYFTRKYGVLVSKAPAKGRVSFRHEKMLIGTRPDLSPREFAARRRAEA